MVNPLSVQPFYRETWGYYDPIAIAQLSPLAYDTCYEPKYYKAPDDDAEILAATGSKAYLQFGLVITPGSIIWGIFHKPAADGFDTPGFSFKMTDMSLQHEIWDTPQPDGFFCNNEPGEFPWLFPSPYPVVGSGLFKCEFWNNSGSPLRCNMIFGVCEVVKCKY
jgi:hypothetical protein